MKIEELEKIFSQSVSWDKNFRDDASIDYQYYNGLQWTSDEIDALKSRGQAVTTYNHIAPAVDAVIGGERQNRPDIKMIGRTNDDERVAQVKTNLYNYIQYNSNTDDELDKMVQDFLVAGRGWIGVYPDMLGDEFQDIMEEYIDYRDMFTDPLSKRDDMKDARYLNHAVYVDQDIIKKTFPDFVEESGAPAVVAGFESSSDEQIWYDAQDRKRPRLIKTWFRHDDGSMELSVWVKGQVLYENRGVYTNPDFPYVQCTYKRDLNNFPYGVVRSMRSAQDEVNKRHSKAMHYLNARQVLAEEDAFVDWNDAEKTLAKPDGITKLRDGVLQEGRVQLVDNAALASSHMQMMEHAKGQILALAGINASYMGQSSQYESGSKANSSIQQANNVLVPMLNKIRISRHRLATITMKLVPDFYTENRLVRILQPTGQYAFMPINGVQILENGTLERVNDVTTDDVDIIIEDAPTGLNDRMEQFNQLLQIQGQTQRPIPMEILLRYSSLKDKHQLAEELKQHYAMDAQLQQASGYIQQLEQQVQKLGGQINQVESQLVQANVARAVDKEVNKAKGEIEKEKNAIMANKKP